MHNINFKTYIDRPVSDVFQSLSTGEGWNGCFTRGTIIDLKARTINFKQIDLYPDKVNAEARSKIMKVDENKSFAFTWNEKSPPKPTVVSFNLSPKNKGTIVEIEDAGYPDSKEGLFEYMNYSTGWAELLNLLKVYLESGYQYKNW